MPKASRTFRRAEQEFGEALSVLRGILLEVLEFVIYLSGLFHIAQHLVR